MGNLVYDTRQKLINLSDEKYREFNSKLCPGIDNMIGIRVPILKKISKDIANNQDFLEYIECKNLEYFEEIMLKGLIIGYAKVDFNKRLEYIEQFIPYIDNWAICDIFCNNLKSIKDNKEKMYIFLKKYIDSKDEFELRFLIVILLDYYVEEKYINEILNILDKIKHNGYYVKMAIAWAISVIYIKFPKYTMKYLKNNTLDKFTYNKSLQKIIESNRVSNEEKIKFKNMKKI